MTITLNGQQRNIPDQILLNDLVSQNARHPEHVIAELNGQIINKACWNTTAIKNGDTLELVSFVGGG